MSASDGFFPRVVIWGVGLIGGSIGMALRQERLAERVIGIGREPLNEAVRLGAIDSYTLDPAEALAQADLLILAMPVGASCELAAEWGPRIRPGTLVTDVGSTKATVVAAWEQHLAPGVAFVGGHPMFGRERSGVGGASPHLLPGARWALTPGARASEADLARLSRLIEALGAQPIRMGPAEHDRRVAGVSHLPQLVATALAAAVCELDDRNAGTLDLAAGGFRDTTRIADSAPQLWGEIWGQNQGPLREAILAFRQALGDLEAAIEAGDGTAIAALFEQAQQGRRRGLGGPR